VFLDVLKTEIIPKGLQDGCKLPAFFSGSSRKIIIKNKRDWKVLKGIDRD